MTTVPCPASSAVKHEHMAPSARYATCSSSPHLVSRPDGCHCGALDICLAVYIRALPGECLRSQLVYATERIIMNSYRSVNGSRLRARQGCEAGENADKPSMCLEKTPGSGAF